MAMNLNLTEPRRFYRWSVAPMLVAPAVLLFASLATAEGNGPGTPVEAPAASVSSDPLAASNLENGTSSRVVKSDAEWRSLLTREQYLVTRMGATEPAFSGKYAAGHYKGTFLCVCCGAALFDARTKYDSGTGWPSFWRPLTAKAMTESLDRSGYEPRIEVRCSRCGAHLGHVFADGPAPTGLRYCINSLALELKPEATKASAKQKAPSRTTTKRRGSTSSSGR